MACNALRSDAAALSGALLRLPSPGSFRGFRWFQAFSFFLGCRVWKIACRLLPAAGFRVSIYPHGGGGKAGGLEVMGLSFSSACFRALCFVLCVARCLSRAAVADSGLGIFSRLP